MATISPKQTIVCADQTEYNNLLAYLDNRQLTVAAGNLANRQEDAANFIVTISYPNWQLTI